MSYNIGSVDRNGLYRRNLSHYAPTLPVDLIKTKCPYIKVRNKISNVVRWIFKQISSLFFSKPKKVKKREVAAREYARNITEIKATRPEPPKRPVPASTSDEKKSNQPTIENPVMREFHVVTQELVGTTIDTVFEKKIRPKLSGFQEGLDKASEFTHLGADLAITVGVKVMPSLFNKLKEFNAKEKIQPELKKLLNWLLQVENKPKLEKDLRERIKSIQIGEKEKDLCLDWLLRTEHDQSLEDFYSGPGIKIEGKEKQIEKMFEEAILLLAESKIRQYTRLWHEKMDTQLPDIIHKTMLINGQKVSSILIQRLIALLEKTKCKTAPEKTKYTTAFDELTGMVFDQTKAVIAVEEAKKRMIKKKEPEKAEENGLLVYAYQRLCHPKISELIGRTDLTVAQKEEMEKEFFENIAERMIPLLFPDQTVQLPGGQEHKVDGLVYLLNQIELPEECKELLRATVELSKEIFSPKIQKSLKEIGALDGFWAIAYDRAEEIILKEVKKEMQKAISATLQKIIVKFITPKSLDEMMAKRFMPAIQRQLLKSMAREFLSTNESLSKTLQEQSKLVKSDKKKTEETHEVVCMELYNLSRKACKQYQEEFEGISFETYKKFILPVIEDYGKNNKGSSVKENPLFGELIINLMKKLGGLEFKGKITHLFLDNLIVPRVISYLASKEIPIMLRELRESPDFLVELATKEIRESCLQEGNIEAWLFEKPGEAPKEKTDEALKEATSKTAKVLYDLFYLKAGDRFKQYFGPDATKLDETISAIYQKVLGDKRMNQNLLLTVQDYVVGVLEEASKTLQEDNKSLRPHKVEHLPTLLPECLVACL